MILSLSWNKRTTDPIASIFDSCSNTLAGRRSQSITVTTFDVLWGNFLD